MDSGLKQRLVGAVVLTAVGVLFLPVLFDQQIRRQVDMQTQIPPQPTAIPLEIRAPIRPQGIVPAKPPQDMFQPRETPLVGTGEVSGRLSPQGIPRAWVVQVASFKAARRAQKLQDRLLADGYKAYSREVKTANGTVIRVFVGPKIDKHRAMAIKQALDKSLKLNTLLLRFQP